MKIKMILILRVFLFSAILQMVYSTFDVNVVNLEQLSRNIEKMFDDREHDQILKIVVKNQAYFAHKNTLSIASSYLSEQIQKSKKGEIKLLFSELTHNDSFFHVLKYIYTGKLVLINQDLDRIFDLMTISKKLNLTSLIEETSILLEKALTLENVVSIYDKSNIFDQIELRESCKNFIDENAELLFSQKSLAQLPRESLREILGRDSFSINETKVFKIVGDWHVFHNRTEQLDTNLIKIIRLDLIPDDELFDLNNRMQLIGDIDLIEILNARKTNRSSHVKPTRKQLLANKRLASGSADNSIKIWNVDSGECIRTLTGHTSFVRSLQLLGNNNSNKLASGSKLGKIKIWNVDTAECVRTLYGHSKDVWSLQLLDDNRLASSSGDKSIKIWNIVTGACMRTLTNHTNMVFALQRLADHKLASGSYDRTIKIWNVDTGVCMRTLTGHTHSVWSLELLGDNKLASGSCDKTIRIWNVYTGACIRTLTGHTSNVRSLQLLANSKLASGSNDKSIKIWNVDTGECIRTLAGHSSDVWSLQLLADNKLASGSGDKSIKIWNIDSGECIRTLHGHSSDVWSLQLLANL